MKNGSARKAKGRVGMAEAADYLTSIGIRAESARGMKDIVLLDLDFVHVEVKRVESFRVGSSAWTDALHQAADDAKVRGKEWAVLWRVNRLDWCLTYPDHWILTALGGPAIADRLRWLNGRSLQRADAALPLTVPPLAAPEGKGGTHV